jgi:outer membrane protein assembly factor BamA
MRYFKIVLLTTFGSILSLVHAQDSSVVVVDSIEFEGNKKTKNRILLRELTFTKGDTIPLSMLNTTLEQNRLRLMNTNLFFTTKSNIKKWDGTHITILFTVRENWFLFPVPIFELADRNFNVWWKEQNRSFRRTNYGVRLTYNNATGHRDPFSGLIQLGYTPKYTLNYSLPYINKKQTIGLSFGYFSAVNREVGYKTDSNKLVFFKDTARFLQNRRAISAGLSYTPGLYANHYVSIGYSNNKVDTFVAQTLNQDFFLERKMRQRYWWMYYSFNYDKRDIRPYPLNGFVFNFYVQKNGFFKNDDVNSFDASVRFTKFTPLSTKWYIENTAKVKTALVRQYQPYNLMRGLGFGSDFIRGYEYYVSDALDYAYSKNSLKFQLFDKKLDWRKYALIKKYDYILEVPLKSYVTFNFDAGYTNNPYRKVSNTLTNRAIYGGGVGLDLIIYYNMVFRFEYSMNHLMERGLYFSYSGGF